MLFLSIKRLVKSFKYALSGILRTVKFEQNMRIHITVANLIIAFAYFFGISKIEWAVLFFSIGFVIFAELINTAIERTADAVTEDYNDLIKYAKDAAAGAVIIAAITSMCIGVVLFGNFEKIISTLLYIVTHIHSLAVFLCLFILDIILLIKLK